MLIDGPDPHQMTAKLPRGIAYKNLKALLVLIETVGYALPPVKAVAAGINSILTVVDVCTAASQWVVRELMSLMRQKVNQNKEDYDDIRQKLEAILSIAQKHAQNGPQQRPLDRRLEGLARCVVL